MSRYITEFIGTFFLVLTIGLAVASESVLAPLAIGSALMVMVYLGGHISGAHYNPAITVAVFIRGKVSAKDVAPYWVSQIGGALAGAAVSQWFTGQTFATTPAITATLLAALSAEFLFTFALALVVLNVATSPKTQGNSYYGLAIGFTVLAGAVAAGPISGGAFNPAVGIGSIVVDSLHGGASLSKIWIPIVGPVAGAIAAAFVYRLQHEGVKD